MATALTVAQFLSEIDALASLYTSVWGDGLKYGSGLGSVLALTDTSGAGTVTSNGTQITGSGTAFTSFFSIGQAIKSGSEAHRIQMIVSDTVLIIDTAPTTPWSGAAYSKAADWGMSKASRNLENLIVGVGATAGLSDFGLVNAQAANADKLAATAAHKALLLAIASPNVYNLNTACGLNSPPAGVVDIESFAKYNNTGAGGPYLALLPPDWVLLYNAIFSVFPGAYNVYPPQITNMASKVVGGSYTQGPNVDTVKFAGFTRLQITMTGITGSGNVTATVNGLDANGVAQTGDTVTFTGVNANAAFAGTLGATVKAVTAITAITFPGGISAGTGTIAGLIPSGRSNPVIAS